MAKWIVGAVAVVAVLIGWSQYNGLVNSDEQVRQTYAQTQNVMERQANLIPNLVATVKGSAQFETKTLTQVMEARAKLSAVAKLDPEKLAANPELQKQLIEAQSAGNTAMLNLQAVREAYPDLKASAQFASLMTQLEGSQNRITVERRNNQLAIQDYNIKTRSALSGVVAKITGFQPRPYFEASAAGQATPQVSF